METGEKKIFKTLLNNSHELRGDRYVEGRIFGIAEIMCEALGGYRNRVSKDGNIRFLETWCTEEKYEKFKSYVENLYPGLCMFHYHYEGK